MKIWGEPIADHFKAIKLDLRPQLIYLAAPALLFLLSFIKPHIGLLAAGLLLLALAYSMQDRSGSRGFWAAPSMGALFILLLIGFMTGSYCWDWIKHWALLNELANRPWPVVIELRDAPQYLRFYLGAYLVPALAHHLAPALPLFWTTAAWFGLGFVFVFRYAALASGKKRWAWLAILVLLMLGGADFYAEHWYRYINELPLHSIFGIRYWVSANDRMPLEYSSFLTSLTWVPHQSIATFLVAAMLINLQDGSKLPQALLGLGLLAFWSPFGMLGLFPLAVLQTIRYLPALRTTHGYASVAAGGCFALIVVAFLMADLPPSVICVSCIPARILDIQYLALIILVELLPFALILRKRMLNDWSCLISTIMLILIPLPSGGTGDFLCRVSLGPLFVLGLRSIQTVFESQTSYWSRTAQALAFCLCLPATLSEAVYHLQNGKAHLAYSKDDTFGGSWLRTFATRTDYTMTEFLDISGWHFAPQYVSTRPPLPNKDQ